MQCGQHIPIAGDLALHLFAEMRRQYGASSNTMHGPIAAYGSTVTAMNVELDEISLVAWRVDIKYSLSIRIRSVKI